MASTGPADAGHTSTADENADILGSSNHDLPARSLSTDAEAVCEEGKPQQQQQPQQVQKDDPATMAASEELRHTSIEDKVAPSAKEEKEEEFTAAGHARMVHATTEAEDNEMEDSAAKASTPEAEHDKLDIQDEEMRERLASPKKKRGRDQDEDEAGDVDGEDVEEGSSADGSVVNGGRTTRLGPEKKRPRDTSEEGLKGEKKDADELLAADTSDISKTTIPDNETSLKPAESLKPVFGSSLTDPPQTSTTAFASSGFGALASSSTSPFGVIGASKPSIFASGTSGFSTLARSKAPPANQLGSTSGDKPPSGFGFGGAATSGFGGLATTSPFGSALGNGFASGSGPKLSSFAAAPGKENAILGAKPAKAFGAPESDEEDGSDAEDSEGGENEDEEEGVRLSPEDKKKAKVMKVEDGEAGESTLLQIRAKLFVIEDKEAGWKERGVGTLKINVPRSCASFDDRGAPIPGSFDASGLEDEDDPNAPKVPRLIMRQENTHRVILNTAIIPAMTLEEKPAASSTQLMFTGFDGTKPKNMLLRVSEANGRLFRSEIDSIQHELM